MTSKSEWQKLFSHIVDSYQTAAKTQYGEEAVTELEHSLQCAELADKAGADEELVLACLLHDVARFAVPQDEVSDTLEKADIHKTAKGHGMKAAELMSDFLPENSLFYIQHHAEAKQYLCQTQPGYKEKLSAASIKTMKVQSLDTDSEKLDALSKHPWWNDAVRLRVWDDAAKVKGKETRSLDYWLARLNRFLVTYQSKAQAS